jgi:hypothetical protein
MTALAVESVSSEQRAEGVRGGDDADELRLNTAGAQERRRAACLSAGARKTDQASACHG